MAELFLMNAEFFGAIGAFKISVRILGETFGIFKERDLPSDEQCYSKEQKAPC